MLRALAPVLTFILLLMTGAAPARTAEERSQACTGWKAQYSANLDENGSRAVVEFVGGEGTEPHPLRITGLTREGRKLWRHTGIYWCYQGSGGCYAGLGYKDKKRTEDEGENSLRLVFADARPGDTDPNRAADILVIAGINSAFFYAQNGGGLAIKYFGSDREPVFVPEVFYFEKCKVDN